MNKSKILSTGIALALFLNSGISYAPSLVKNIAHANDVVTTAIKEYKSLEDGEYTLGFLTKNANMSGELSMANDAMVKPAKLIVDKGEYKVQITFQPIEIGDYVKLKGYLGDLFYYNSQGQKIPANPLSFYSPEDKDLAFEEYKNKYPERSSYPKDFEFPIDKSAINENGILVSKIGVYVPMMAKYGNKDALVEFDFNSLTLVKSNAEKANPDSSNSDNKDDNKPKDNNAAQKETEKFVSLNIEDEGPMKADVRRAVEKIAKLREINGKKELVITYYNKQTWGANNKYDNGLIDIWYNYDGGEEKNELTPKIIESGENYSISEVTLTIDNNKPIYLFGRVVLTPETGATRDSYGKITFDENNSNLITEKNNTIKLLRVSQYGASEKDSNIEKLPFDYEKNGILYSPYTADNGKKFKLADGKFEAELNFERINLLNTDVRYIKYTLDSSEPTKNSKSADLRSQSSDLSLPTNLYRIFVNPLEDIQNFSKEGGDVTVKVKAFNANGEAVTDTQTYTIPFSKYYIDEIPFELELDKKLFKAKLNSNNSYVLTDDVVVKTENANYIKDEIKDKAEKLGLKNISASKISLVRKDDNNIPYTPEYINGWLADKNPLLKVDLTEYSSDVNQQVYFYNTDNGDLSPIPTSVSKYTNKLSFSLNQQEGIYVLASVDNEKLLAEEKEKLTAQVAQAKIVLDNAPTSKEKVKLSQAIEYAEKILPRKTTKLDAILKANENITNAIRNIENAKFNNSFLKTKAEENNKLLENPLLKELLSEAKYNKLMALKEEININLSNPEKLHNLLENLDKELTSLEYKYRTQDIDYMIENYSRPGVESMASGVFDNKNARLIYTSDKTYLELNLQTMTIFGIRAHLTDLDIFKDKLDGEQLNVHTISKFDDTSLSGKLALFDKKLLIELEREAKQEYIVRLGNDGMGGAKPQAKLVIKTKVENNVPSLISLTDNINNISVTSYEIPQNSKLLTKKLNKNITKLAGKDYDLYDIEINDKLVNKKLDIKGNLEITVPKKADRKVDKVYYVAENGDLEEKNILNQNNDSVTFSTDHLSEYALVYANNSLNNEPANSNNSSVNLADFRNLPDGEYTLDFEIFNYSSPSQLSMSNDAVIKPAKLVVKNGEYRVELTFTPLSFLNQRGYLGNLAYYDANGAKRQATILSYYPENEVDNFINVYKQAFPDRNAYPKVLTYPIDKNAIAADGSLKTRINVFVPVMASIRQEIGYQDALPTYYFNKLSLIKRYGPADNGENVVFSGGIVQDPPSPLGSPAPKKLAKTGLNSSSTGTLVLGALLGVFVLRRKFK